MSWLVKPPAAPPPPPGHVDVEAFMGQAAEIEQSGGDVPAFTYLRNIGPKVQPDKWGQPLPLSAPDQARLDRLFALLASPADRAPALVLSGTLDPGETEALRQVFPDIYVRMVQQARIDMATTPPPYAAWAESTLGILFGMQASKVYNDAPPPPASNGKSKDDEPSGATAADRREVSVRQQKGS